jgi:hypothetical protein
MPLRPQVADLLRLFAAQLVRDLLAEEADAAAVNDNPPAAAVPACRRPVNDPKETA